MSDRDTLRVKQDRLLEKYARFIKENGEGVPITEGGPTIAEIRKYVCPKWEYVIDDLLQRED